MNETTPLFTQIDISASMNTPAHPGGMTVVAESTETNRLLRDMVMLQNRSCELLAELVSQVSLQQRQRAAELKSWRQAAESLAKVHTEFLGTVAHEAFMNAEDFADSEYALGEFIDRHGPRLAHFNGVLQLFAQLGAQQPATEN